MARGRDARRLRKPISFSVRLVATASLAASMKSSMTWWLSSLTARWAPVTCPWSPRSISISGRDSSSAPRANRRRRRIIASSSISPSIAAISGATPG